MKNWEGGGGEQQASFNQKKLPQRTFMIAYQFSESIHGIDICSLNKFTLFSFWIMGDYLETALGLQYWVSCIDSLIRWYTCIIVVCMYRSTTSWLLLYLVYYSRSAPVQGRSVHETTF